MAHGRWTSERGVLYVIDSDPLLVTPRIVADFKEAGRDNAVELAAVMHLQDPGMILGRLASGRRCFGGWVEGRLAAYGWVSRTAECIGEQEREIRLPANEAYIWNCETQQEYRGRRLYSALLSYMVAVLRKEGTRRVWIGTALSNHASLRGFVNAGFRPVMMLLYYRLFSAHIVLQVGHHAAPPQLVADARRAVTMENERAWGPFVFGGSRPLQLPTCAEIEA